MPSWPFPPVRMTHHSNVVPPPFKNHGECRETPPITLFIVYLQTNPTSCPSSLLCVEVHITSPWKYCRGLFVSSSCVPEHTNFHMGYKWVLVNVSMNVASFEEEIYILCWNSEPSTKILSCLLMCRQALWGLTYGQRHEEIVPYKCAFY